MKDLDSIVSDNAKAASPHIVRTPDGRFTVLAAVLIGRKDVADILTTCFEGGSNYWIGKVERRGEASFDVEGFEAGDKDRWHSHFCAAGGSLLITEDEEGGSGKPNPLTLTADDLVRGIVLAASHYKRDVRAWLDDCPDAGESDVALQFAVFGEIVYG